MIIDLIINKTLKVLFFFLHFTLTNKLLKFTLLLHWYCSLPFSIFFLSPLVLAFLFSNTIVLKNSLHCHFTHAKMPSYFCSFFHRLIPQLYGLPYNISVFTFSSLMFSPVSQFQSMLSFVSQFSIFKKQHRWCG